MRKLGIFAIGVLLLAPAIAHAGRGGGHFGGFGGFGGRIGGLGGGHIGGFGAGRIGGFAGGAPGGFTVPRGGMYTGNLLGYGGRLGMPAFGAPRGFAPRAYIGHGAFGGPPTVSRGQRYSNVGAQKTRETFSHIGPDSTHSLTSTLRRGTVIDRAAFSRAGIGRANAFAHRRWGGKGWEPHRLHRRGRFGAFFLGSVFWPYGFGDFFSWAFWPEDYYDSFWGYGPDSLLWGAFWPYGDYGYGIYAPEEANFGSFGAGDIYSGYRAPAPEQDSAACSGFSPGLPELPLERLAEIVRPTDEQRAAFQELQAATAKAKEILSKSCPASTPETPVARLDAMKMRLQALLQAERTVRQPLLRLYAMLDESQKQALRAAAKEENERRIDLTQLCSSEASFTNAPADQIERTVRLDRSQMQLLGDLKRASNQAARMLEQTCPAETRLSLESRLDEAETRIEALIRAVDIVRPAADRFFASLSQEQRRQLTSQANVRSASQRAKSSR